MYSSVIRHQEAKQENIPLLLFHHFYTHLTDNKQVVMPTPLPITWSFLISDKHPTLFTYLHFAGNTNWHRTGNQLANYSALMQQSHVTSSSLQQSNFTLSASQMIDHVTTPSSAVTTTLLSTPSCTSTTQANSNVTSHGMGYSTPSSSVGGDYQHCNTSAPAGVWGSRLNSDPNWSHHAFPSINDTYG